MSDCGRKNEWGCKWNFVNQSVVISQCQWMKCMWMWMHESNTLKNEWMNEWMISQCMKGRKY